MMVVLTSVYAALLALLFLLLSAYTIVLRRRHAVALGDGDVGALQAAIRSHANFAEYVPLALLLMFFLELAIGSGAQIHTFGVMLVVGRILHAVALNRTPPSIRLRVVGMGLTLSVVVACSVRLLGVHWFGWS